MRLLLVLVLFLAIVWNSFSFASDFIASVYNSVNIPDMESLQSLSGNDDGNGIAFLLMVGSSRQGEGIAVEQWSQAGEYQWCGKYRIVRNGYGFFEEDQQGVIIAIVSQDRGENAVQNPLFCLF